MGDKLSRIGKIASILILLTGVIWTIVYQKTKYRALTHVGQITDGFVYGYYVGNVKAPGISFKYYYFINDKKKFSVSIPYYLNNNAEADNFLNKSFPVLVDTANIRNSQLLISRWMFDKFKVPFPDSLQWAQQYID